MADADTGQGSGAGFSAGLGHQKLSGSGVSVFQLRLDVVLELLQPLLLIRIGARFEGVARRLGGRLCERIDHPEFLRVLNVLFVEKRGAGQYAVAKEDSEVHGVELDGTDL